MQGHGLEEGEDFLGEVGDPEGEKEPKFSGGDCLRISEPCST